MINYFELTLLDPRQVQAIHVEHLVSAKLLIVLLYLTTCKSDPITETLVIRHGSRQTDVCYLVLSN